MTYRFNTAILGILALVVPFVMWPGMYDFTLHPRMFVIQTGLLLCCAALVTVKGDKQRRHPILLAVGAWASWTVLSAFWAVNPIEALIQASRLVTFALLALVVGTAIRPRDVFTIYACAALAGALVSIVGIGQYFGWGFAWIPSVGNPSATFGYRNFAASYLIASIPCAVLFAQTADRRWARTTWTISGLLMAIFLAYTRTRGAWVGLGGAVLISAAVGIYLHRQNWRLPFQPTTSKLVGIGICLAFILGAATLQPRMKDTGKFGFDERKTDAVTTLSTTFSPSDARGRLTVWPHTLEMVRDHPLMGVGLGSWQFVYPRYDRGDWITHNTAPQRPHNDLLWILSETGVIGFGLFLYLLFSIGQATLLSLKHHPERRETLWMIGLSMGLIAFLGHGFFSFPKERAAPALMFWLAAGSLARLSTEGQTPTPSIRPLFALAMPLLICSLILTYRTMRFDTHYLRAHRAYRVQNWPALASETESALRWGPLNHRVMLLNGFAHQQNNDLASAISAYRQSHRYHPNEGHGALASAYAAAGQTDSALVYYEREAALFPKSPRATRDLADAYANAGRPDRAAQTYRRLLALTPKNLDVWKKLAALEAQLGNDATQIYQDAQKHFPNDVELLIQTGNDHQSKKRWDKAAAAYSRALEQKPDDPTLYNNLGAVRSRQRRYAEAEAAYRKALALKPGYARVYHNLGDLYAAQQDTGRAISAYRAFIQSWQGDARFAELARDKIRRLSP